MIDRAEYKRRQAAPGVKITPKAFGRDRRLPITNRYEGYNRAQVTVTLTSVSIVGASTGTAMSAAA